MCKTRNETMERQDGENFVVGVFYIMLMKDAELYMLRWINAYKIFGGNHQEGSPCGRPEH